jgi:ankyrin repeat protein
VCWGNLEIVELLVKNNANINEKNSYEDTPLHDGDILKFIY